MSQQQSSTVQHALFYVFIRRLILCALLRAFCVHSRVKSLRERGDALWQVIITLFHMGKDINRVEIGAIKGKPPPPKFQNTVRALLAPLLPASSTRALLTRYPLLPSCRCRRYRVSVRGRAAWRR